MQRQEWEEWERAKRARMHFIYQPANREREGCTCTSGKHQPTLRILSYYYFIFRSWRWIHTHTFCVLFYLFFFLSISFRLFVLAQSSLFSLILLHSLWLNESVFVLTNNMFQFFFSLRTLRTTYFASMGMKTICAQPSWCIIVRHNIHKYTDTKEIII